KGHWPQRDAPGRETADQLDKPGAGLSLPRFRLPEILRFKPQAAGRGGIQVMGIRYRIEAAVFKPGRLDSGKRTRIGGLRLLRGGGGRESQAGASQLAGAHRSCGQAAQVTAGNIFHFCRTFLRASHFCHPGERRFASKSRNRPTSVTTPPACPVPRSETLVATAGLISTQTILTHEGSILPVAMEWSIDPRHSTRPAPRSCS